MGRQNWWYIDSGISRFRREGDSTRAVSPFRGWLIGFKLEPDKDLHLVLADEDDPETTLVAEIPNADVCAGACNSPQAARFQAARAAFVAAFTPRKCFAYVDQDIVVTITGVGSSTGSTASMASPTTASSSIPCSSSRSRATGRSRRVAVDKQCLETSVTEREEAAMTLLRAGDLAPAPCPSCGRVLRLQEERVWVQTVDPAEEVKTTGPIYRCVCDSCGRESVYDTLDDKATVKP